MNKPSLPPATNGRPGASAEERRLLSEVSLLLHSGRSVEATFGQLDALLRPVLRHHYMGLVIPARREGEFELAGSSPFLRPAGLVIPDAGDLVRRVAESEAGFATFVTAAIDAPWDAELRRLGMEHHAAVALAFEGRSLGFLHFARRDVPFGPLEQALIRSVGPVFAAGIDAYLRKAAMEASSRRRTLVAELASMLSSGEPLDSIFDRFASTVGEAIDFDLIVLNARPAGGGPISVVRAIPEILPAGTQTPVRPVRLEELRAQRRSVMQYQPQHEPGPGDAIIAQAGYRRLMLGLLSFGDEDLGLLALARSTPGPFSEEDEDFAAIVAALLGQAVANEHRLARVRETAERSAVLNEMSVLLHTGERVETIFERLPSVLARGTSFDYVEFAERRRPGEFQILVSWPPRDPPVTMSLATEGDIELIRSSGRRVVQYRPGAVADSGARAFVERGLGRALTILVDHQGETLGLFTLGRRDGPRWSPAEEEFLAVASTLFGQALANQRRLERVERVAARNRALNEIGVLLNQGGAVQDVFARLPEFLGTLLEFDSIGLGTPGPAPRTLQVVHHGALAPFGGVVPFELVNLESHMERGAAVALTYWPAYNGGIAEAFQAAGITWTATAILRLGGQALGMLQVGRAADRPFDSDEQSFLEALGTLFAQAIASQERIAAKAREAARSQLLNRISILLNAGEPTAAIFDTVEPLVREAMEADIVILMTRRDEDGLYHALGTTPGFEIHEPRLRTSAQLGIDAMRVMGIRAAQRRPAAVADQRVIFPGLAERGANWLASSMLEDGADSLGTIVLARMNDREFSPEEMHLLETLATLFAQAIAAQARIAAKAQEAARAELLNRVSILLNAGEPVHTIFHQVEPLVREGMACDVVALFAQEIETGDYSFAGVTPGVDATRTGTRSRADLGIDWFRSAGLRVAQASAASLPEGVNASRFLANGIQVFAACLLNDGNETIGLLTVGRRNERAFTAQEMELLELLSTLFAQAAANMRRLQSSRLEAEEQRMIAAMAAAVAREPDPARLVAVLHREMRAIYPQPAVGIGFREGDEVFFPVADGTQYRRPMHEWYRAAEATGQNTGPWEDGALVSEPAGERVYSDAAITVARSGGETVGYLVTASGAEGFRFHERELRLFRILAQILGPAMASARAAEQTARERALYDQALQSLSEGVILIDHEMRPVYANAEGRHVVRTVTLQDVPDQSLETVIPELPNSTAAVFRAALEEGRRGRALHHDTSDDTYTNVEVVPLRHPAYRLLIVTRDVTDQVRREEQDRRHMAELDNAARALAEERSLLQTVMDTMTEAIVLVDHDFRVVFENGPGRMISDLLDPAREKRTIEQHALAFPRTMRPDFLAAARDGQQAGGRAVVRIGDGQRWFDYQFIPLNQPGLRLLALARDVTAEVEREEEQRSHREQMEQAARLAALGELIGGVAHELNNPLTAILGFSEVMAGSANAPLFHEEIDVIQKEARRARDVVRDLLFIARPGAVERGPVLLQEVVGHVERVRRSAWTRVGLAVEIDLSGIETPAWGNEHQLTQVLLNLVSNAEQAMEGRLAPRLTIRASSNRDGAALEVCDNGVGMDEATRARVFEPFYTTRQGVGTGLGLSISFSMMAAHKGGLECISTPGEGTTFRAWLPPGDALAPPAPAPVPATSAAFNVLVIDDEPSVRTICQRLVRSLGHNCDVADSVPAALAAVRSETYDAIVCDFRLGTENADVFVDTVFRETPDLVRRISIATGATTDAGVIDLIGRYGLRLIAKPYGARELREVLADASVAASVA